MDINLARTFLEIVATGNFLRAAERRVAVPLVEGAFGVASLLAHHRRERRERERGRVHDRRAERAGLEGVVAVYGAGAFPAPGAA